MYVRYRILFRHTKNGEPVSRLPTLKSEVELLGDSRAGIERSVHVFATLRSNQLRPPNQPAQRILHLLLRHLAVELSNDVIRPEAVLTTTLSEGDDALTKCRLVRRVSDIPRRSISVEIAGQYRDFLDHILGIRADGGG